MKVRVKTLAEFGGVRPDSFNDSGEMDYLYGQTVEVEVINGFYYTSARKGSEYGSLWILNETDIVEVGTCDLSDLVESGL